MNLRLSLLSPLLLLAACASPPATPPPAADMPMTCSADAAQRYVGLPATAANIEAVRKASGANLVRALKPDQMVTLEYRGDRVNVLQDANGTIERVSCG
ncbi:I78 family peptidase inhibitor [Thermomonas fusca]|uniref:Peptidase inhibitor I78 family protein n=1 Tax=Thermomonas fusca TaxID=215690 RepID=A0A5R9PGX9_9GAMM|nr:I78 family peptidase inhibitor [Thermomonas fusca]TLX22652.1 hypothetical protein E5S66_01070 [Thermomonas fusca]